MSAGPALGSVHVFNCYNEPVAALSVAGYVAGDLGPLADGEDPPGLAPFTPLSIEVPRTRYRIPAAAFPVGATTVVVPWDSFIGTAVVTVPDPTGGAVSLTDSLVLALNPAGGALLTARGYLLSTCAVALAASRPREDR